MLVLICAYSLKEAVSRHSDSNRIVSLAFASRDLTTALVAFRLERGETLSYLAAASAASEKNAAGIAELRTAGARTYSQALQTLQAVELPGIADHLQKLRGLWEQLEELRPRIAAAV
ncbi:MAG: methyl-accepting chemotaxis protein, partial [Bradyrhizobium sp.]|nr:methyl-accepting chemotaxis protein [Bradyrhizobium sp.]